MVGGGGKRKYTEREMRVFIVFRTYMNQKGWQLFEKVFKAPSSSTVRAHTKVLIGEEFEDGFEGTKIEKNMKKAKKVMKEVFFIDIEKVPCLICEDDTAL